MSQSSTDELASELERVGYHGLFGRPDWRQRLDEMWDKPDVPERLLRLATDADQPWLTRFLASEAIFNKEMFLLLRRPELFASLARVYAKALAENASGFMSHWGFQQDMNDAGTLGSRFAAFGRDSDAALRPLLDETKEVPYVYPPEFPSEMKFGLRLKDFAALHLGAIHGVPLRFTEDPAQRDDEIRRLKQLLP
jgi:hypothetical protein